ncbi:helix-turn-helix domain-containing protein [Romboutsia lituseburensis]|uniref:HTH cro/C1-type domain-containing protein n=1 Tax=Romboutsia lituseburensis DSM 797 TaxID=1121325 RepID=A0A1G9JDZ5_9FIRM|nr:helix-turn-helix domain-containing protein [Romboutsia lituseburensis]CEH33536.1 Transcriptional regulator [Romboutsia lituseburensis]SDL35353.1 Protein of unknown function [Romboutsia lituseburensis DSM 797]
MDKNNINNYSITKIREAMKANNINNNQLSELTCLDKSTISRILNNKQKINISHLQKISSALQIPLQELMELEGYALEYKPHNRNIDFNSNFDNLDDILEIASFIDCESLEANVEKELNKYEQYLQTQEGKDLLEGRFLKKIESINFTGAFIEKLKDLYEIYIKRERDIADLILIGSALLYFIVSTDIIPDFIFPIGFLDDMIAIKLVLGKLK